MAEGGADVPFADGSTCCICLEIFADPRLLSCHHSACELCLEKYVKKTARHGNIVCPICRAKISVPKEGVRGFQKNFYISSSDQKSESILCEIHSKEEAVVFCKTCDSLICVKCALTSHKSHQTSHVEEEVGDVTNQLLTNTAAVERYVKQLQKNAERLLQEKDDMHKAWDVDLRSLGDKSAYLRKSMEMCCEEKLHEVNDYYKNRVKEKETKRETINSELTSTQQLLSSIENKVQLPKNAALVRKAKHLLKELAKQRNETRPSIKPKPLKTKVSLNRDDKSQITKAVRQYFAGSHDVYQSKSSEKDIETILIFPFRLQDVRTGTCGFVSGIATVGNNAWVTTDSNELVLTNTKGQTLRSIALEMSANRITVDIAGNCFISFERENNQLGIVKSDGSLALRNFENKQRLNDMCYRITTDGKEELLFILEGSTNSFVYQAQKPEYNPVRLRWDYPDEYHLSRIASDPNSELVCVASYRWLENEQTYNQLEEVPFCMFYRKGSPTIRPLRPDRDHYKIGHWPLVCDVAFDSQSFVIVCYRHFVERLNSNGDLMQTFFPDMYLISLDVNENDQLWLGLPNNDISVYQMSLK